MMVWWRTNVTYATSRALVSLLSFECRNGFYFQIMHSKSCVKISEKKLSFQTGLTQVDFTYLHYPRLCRTILGHFEAIIVLTRAARK